MSSIVTAQLLRDIMPQAPATQASIFASQFALLFPSYGIMTKLRIAHFLAQIAHETGQLHYREEIASGKDYEGRKDLGNTEVGDGVRFKGRGLIQLTGRYNYKQFANAVNRPEIMETPEIVATDDELCATSALYYWRKRGLNTLADQDNLLEITKRINGGTRGLADRVNFYRRAKIRLGEAAQ